MALHRALRAREHPRPLRPAQEARRQGRGDSFGTSSDLKFRAAISKKFIPDPNWIRLQRSYGVGLVVHEAAHQVGGKNICFSKFAKNGFRESLTLLPSIHPIVLCSAPLNKNVLIMPE